MKERMETLAKIFEKLGLSPERFRVKYVLVAEGVKFADPIRMRTEQMERLEKDRIKAENEKLRPTLERMLSKRK